MEGNDKIIANDTNNSLLNNDQQLTEINRNIVHNLNFSKEYAIYDQRSNQYTGRVKNCKEVHFGPKIENHYHLPITSDSTKFHEIYNYNQNNGTIQNGSKTETDYQKPTTSKCIPIEDETSITDNQNNCTIQNGSITETDYQKPTTSKCIPIEDETSITDDQNNGTIQNGSKTETDNQKPTTSKCIPIEDETSINRTLAKCKERLKYRYRTNFQYMRSFLWKENRNDLTIEDYFVELIVEKSDNFGKKARGKINLNKIFSKEEDIRQAILITGGPGYGKTTICKKIAYDWAINELKNYYSRKFDLVILLLLHEVNNESLYDLIMDIISKNDEEKSKIKKENLNILIILDGFDEMLNKNSVLEFIRDKSFDISSRMTILVTSRLQEMEKIREYMTTRFSVEGFSEQEQQKYIRLMFKKHEDKGKHLLQMLKENDFYLQIGKNPLMLHMLCCLHLYYNENINDCITTLYIKIFSLITERYINKYGGNYNFEKGNHFFGEDLLIRLGKFIQLNNRPIPRIISKDLKDLFPIEEEFNFIVGLDILEFHSFIDNENDYYEFVHFSFKEFICVLSTYRNLNCYDFISSEYSLLFLIGFFGTELFPKKLQEYFMKRVFSPKFMIQAYREIKLKENWELLCSLSDVKFYYYDIDDIKLLLKRYDFTKLHLCFPKNKSDYIIAKDKLIDFNNNCDLSERLIINIFPVFIPEKWENGQDLREVALCIIDFFCEIGPIKHKIYFSGIYFISTWFMHFMNVKYSVQLPEYIKESLNANENEEFVMLETTFKLQGIKDFLISAEQYEILRDRIKTSSLLKIEYKCMII